jgi:hypothetical protein
MKIVKINKYSLRAHMHSEQQRSPLKRHVETRTSAVEHDEKVKE